MFLNLCLSKAIHQLDTNTWTADADVRRMSLSHASSNLHAHSLITCVDNPWLNVMLFSVYEHTGQPN